MKLIDIQRSPVKKSVYWLLWKNYLSLYSIEYLIDDCNDKFDPTPTQLFEKKIAHLVYDHLRPTISKAFLEIIRDDQYATTVWTHSELIDCGILLNETNHEMPVVFREYGKIRLTPGNEFE